MKRSFGSSIIHIITLPLPFPQVQSVNVYLLGKGEHYILIDTGTCAEDSYSILLSYFKKNNIKHIDSIYLTHGHIDHFGAAAKLIKDGIADKAFIHKGDVDIIKNEYDEPLYNFYLKQYGVPDNIMEMMKLASIFFDRFSDRLENVSFIREDTPIQYDEGTLQVIHTPGHTSGSVCFYDKNTRLMLSGDTLLSKLSPNPILDLQKINGERRKSLVEYISSLDMLYNMDINVVYPGHYEIISDHKALIKRLFNFHYKRMMYIHNIIKQKPMTPYEILGDLFKKLRKRDIFLAISEVIGHLDLLEEKNMAATFKEKGHIYYAAN